MRYKKDLAEFISIADGARLIQERAGLPEDEAREDIVFAVRDRALESLWWRIVRGERSWCDVGLLPHGFLDSLTPDLIDWEHSIARRGSTLVPFTAEIEVSRAGVCRLWPEQGNSRQIITAAAEMRCRDWLIEFMSKGSTPDRPKSKYRLEAKEEFGVGTKAFDRAWHDAIIKTGNVEWSKAGRKSLPLNHHPN